MPTRTQQRKTFLGALLGFAVATSTPATEIPLVNPSFESPVVGAWSASFQPAGWSKNYGTFMQSPAAHHGSQGVVNLARKGFFRLSQNSTYTVARANETLTGKVWVRVTNMESGTSDFELVLLVGGVPVTTNSFAVTMDMLNGQTLEWTGITAEYATSAADVGKTVGVAIGSNGGQSDTYTPSYCYLDEVSLDTVSVGGPTAEGTATPNPAEMLDRVEFSVGVTPGSSPTITKVVLDASAIGGGSAVELLPAGGSVYTNGVTVSAPVAFDSVLQLPATVTDARGLVGQAWISLKVNRPTELTWGGGTGNWNDPNWLPYHVTGPTTGPNRSAIVTNGTVLVNQTGGVGGGVSVLLAPSGVMQVHNGHYGSYGNNVLFAGGTLDTYDNSAYHAYGASILSAVTAEGAVPSSITNSGGGWFNLGHPSTTFTVNEGATLTVGAALAGAVAANDNLFQATALVKEGDGRLVLSGANTYSGGTTVSAGTLSITAIEGLPADTTLTVAGGTRVDLDYRGTIPLSALLLDGVPQASGTYGASGTGATHIDDTHFTGTGLLSVPASLTLKCTRLAGSQIRLSWGGTATLQAQTNALSGDGWADYAEASPVTVPIDPAAGTVFFRLKQ